MDERDKGVDAGIFGFNGQVIVAILFAAALLALLLLTGCTTLHQSASLPLEPVHQPAQDATPSPVIVPPAAQEKSSVVTVLPLPHHEVIHRQKRVTTSVEAPQTEIMPAIRPVAVPIATLKPPAPDWSVQAIGGAVTIWCLVLVGWMWRKRRKPSMADGMDQMVNQMRRDFEKTRGRL